MGINLTQCIRVAHLSWSMVLSSISLYEPHCYRMENNILYIHPTLIKYLKCPFTRAWVISFLPLKSYVFHWKISTLSLLHLNLVLVSLLLSLNYLCWLLLHSLYSTLKTKSYIPISKKISTFSHKTKVSISLAIKIIWNMKKMKYCLESTDNIENDAVCWDKWRQCCARHKLPY